jgi:hypothetical protein
MTQDDVMGLDSASGRSAEHKHLIVAIQSPAKLRKWFIR